MFGTLTEKLQGAFAKLTGRDILSEENVSDAVRQVRLALLEADVNWGVVKTLIKRVKEQTLGDRVIKSVRPSQQFIKIVHDELVSLMGGKEASCAVKGSPATWMVCGLQGSGKTTCSAKLARYLLQKEEIKSPLLVACDLQRPAAVEQLHILGKQIGVSVFSLPGETDPTVVAKAAQKRAKEQGHDLVIVDTAGRLHIDQELMKQLVQLKALLDPQEILFVANAATGQDAVTVAAAFDQEMAVTGTVLTMLDGDTRGGAAISIREVTGKPLKFEGIGEKVEDLQPFNPTSMADRILGMGDTINLVRKAKEHIDEEETKKFEEKIRGATFTYEDFLKQMRAIKKMGSLKGLLSMLPGLGGMKSPLPVDESEFTKMEAMILSMTQKERVGKSELSVPRRKRIAKGSGTEMADINRLVKMFKQMKQFFKKKMPSRKRLEKMMGGR